MFTTLNSYGQRVFFTFNKTILNCDSVTIRFDENDSLVLKEKLFWKIGADSVRINGKYYYPFVFSTESPIDTIGYIRYFNNSIFILPKKDTINIREQCLFWFSKGNRCKKIHNINHFAGATISLTNSYYSPDYKETIYVFNLDFDYQPASTQINEVHIGIRTGIIKAIFITHYGNTKLDCFY
jgi:hypothetical protein